MTTPLPHKRTPKNWPPLQPYRLNTDTGLVEHWHYHEGGWAVAIKGDDEYDEDTGERREPENSSNAYETLDDARNSSYGGHTILSYEDTWAEPLHGQI